MFKFLSLEVIHWDFWERFSLPLDAEVITVVGPNGSGKTTLLDALRTLLCIECSSGRDFKRYVRRNEKPLAWLRAVVENKRLESGSRPFFPILSDRVTLACRIVRKGGDWQRQYQVVEGDLPVEKLDETGQWLGVREYRSALERAGLTNAISKVLSLEQGDTDKLCEYSPRHLMELVFSVFGDMEVLDNYQQAKNEQANIGRELEKMEDDLAHLGVRLHETELKVNSFREWQRLKLELQKLSIDTLNSSELAELLEKISSQRGVLRKKRWELARLSGVYKYLQAADAGLAEEIKVALAREKELKEQANVAEVEFTAARDAARDTERIIEEKQHLERLCRQQENGFDASSLAVEQREKRAVLANNDAELNRRGRQFQELQERLAAIKAGRKIEPEAVRQFRECLNNASIKYNLLTEIVEISDPAWHKAVEGILGPYAHIVLLANSNDRRKAWELGEKLRYRHFVVAEQAPVPKASPGSLLDVVKFSQQPPGWLADLLDRIRRVETVAEGSALANDISWITKEGYHRERRGGRHVASDGSYKFGEAARLALMEESQAEELRLHQRINEIESENKTLLARIAELDALLSGLDAAVQLASRASEFSRAEKEMPVLADWAQKKAAAYNNAKAHSDDAVEKRHELEKQRSAGGVELRREQETLRQEQSEFDKQKRGQRELFDRFRDRCRIMPPKWYSREAMVQLREQYESTEAVKRDIQRLRQKIAEGAWTTDEQVVAVLDKLRGDYADLEGKIKVRRIHHHRHVTATDDARESYINVLRATIRRYGANVRALGKTAGIEVEVESPHLANDDVTLAQAGLHIKFDFDRKGMIGLNDGEASGGQQVMKSLILLIALLMDDSGSGGFVFIDEPFAHLDVFNIDKVGAFLTATHSQYVLTTPNTHNVNVFKTSDLTLVTRKRQHPDKWAPPVAFLRRDTKDQTL